LGSFPRWDGELPDAAVLTITWARGRQHLGS